MPRLYRYVWYRVRDTSIAEELTAAICERAIEILHRYDPAQGAMGAWIFGIARNEIRSYLRSRRSRPVLSSIDDMLEVHAGDVSVEGAFQRQEDLREVLGHIANLPEREQEIIAMRYGLGLSNHEIAAIMNLTENHLAVLLHRALKKLRQAIKSEPD